MIGYLEKEKKTVNGQHYTSELREQKEEFKSKYKGKLRENTFFIPVNGAVNTAQLTTAETTNRSFELLPHVLILPRLTQSDIILFPKTKSYLRGCHTGNYDESICAVDEQDAILFRDENAVLKHSWTNCNDIKWSYIEKYWKNSFFTNSIWARLGIFERPLYMTSDIYNLCPMYKCFHLSMFKLIYSRESCCAVFLKISLIQNGSLPQRL